MIDRRLSNRDIGLASQDSERGWSSRRISPPLAKRQRTQGKDYCSISDRRITNAFLARSLITSNETQRRHDDYGVPLKSSTDSSTVSWHDSKHPTHVFASSDQRRSKGITSREQSTNSSKLKIACSNRHMKLGLSNKSMCRICMKGANAKYDPIVACPGCHALYHDSCRRPPLTNEVDPKHWRCLKCLGCISRRTSAISITPRSSSSNPSVQSVRCSLLLDSTTNLIANHPLSTPAKAGGPLAKSMGLHKEHPNRSDTSTHLRKRSTPDQFNVQSHICTEIPNTPTQRSSGPLSIPSALFKVQSHLTRDNSQHDDGLMLIEPARPTTIASSAVLCSACRKQRAFVKKRAMDVECHRCQKKTLFAEFGEVEIPETPEAISIIQIEQRGNASMLASSTTPSTFRSLDDRSSLHWFRSELVANTPKITQRKIGDLEHIEAAFASGTCPKYEADTNELSRDFSPKAGPLDHSIEKRATAPAKIIATNALAKGPIKQSNGASQRTAYTNDTSPHVSSKLMTSEVQEPIVISSSLSERYDNSVSEDNTENIVDACPEHLPFHISDWIGSARAEQLSSDSGESPVSVSQSVTKASTEVRYTMRKLTILALVAANGARLTSSQIVMWIAQKFSYLKLGEGEWETSIRSALSLFDEFQGYKIPGTRGRRGQKMWGFTNTHLRAQYEKEYSEYRTAANYPTPPLGRQPATEEASTSVSLLVCERNGAVPPMHLPESTTQQPQTNTKTEILYQASSPRQYENIDMAFMPFERSKPCRRTRALAFDSNSSQKASSLGTHPRALHSSIEAMTDVEKAHKIAEIKARSPRKRYFGSDHRLWHKRRHNLQDIHDERNGAWKRPSMMNKPKTRKEHDVHEGNEDYRTLRQVFDLPDNIIPMNDGQGELAFRDAVMVNGILPRPRNIYKVGKMFGGKLTVRAA